MAGQTDGWTKRRTDVCICALHDPQGQERDAEHGIQLCFVFNINRPSWNTASSSSIREGNVLLREFSRN